MKYRGRVLWVGMAVWLTIAINLPTVSFAAEAPELSGPDGLSFLQLKVTGDEFIVLQNNTGADIPDLSRFALYYFNNVSPLSVGTSSSSQMLPSVILQADKSIMLSSTPRQTCGAEVAGDLTLGLGDSAGFLQVVELATSESGAVLQNPGDVVSWSSGSNGMIHNVPSNTKDPLSVYYRYHNSGDLSYKWQYANLDTKNPCQLNAIIIAGGIKTLEPTEIVLATSNEDIPGVIIKATGNTSAIHGKTATMPAANLGLKAPKVSELLANVKAPAKDADDEFIELYNPNERAFELSGFILQTGSTTSETRRNYVIPKGVMIPAKGFKAFYSKDTRLSLNNTGGQVWLQDPFGTIIGQSDPYTKPKDGTSWASVKTSWYYTTTPTPNAANKVTEPAVSTSTAKSKSAKTSKGVPVVKVASTDSGVAGASSATAYEAAASTVPVHPTTLAIVIGLGLLYVCYEYRHDLANKLHQFRAHRTHRR